MTQLYENDRVEAIQAGAPRRPLILKIVAIYGLICIVIHGIEGALVGGAIVTERPGA